MHFWKKCRKNVEEARARASATEQKEFSRVDDYMCLQRTDVSLAAACARLRTPYVLCVCGHMCALHSSDNSALSFFFQEAMAIWFRHLKPLWIACGDNFKTV